MTHFLWIWISVAISSHRWCSCLFLQSFSPCFQQIAIFVCTIHSFIQLHFSVQSRGTQLVLVPATVRWSTAFSSSKRNCKFIFYFIIHQYLLSSYQFCQQGVCSVNWIYPSTVVPLSSLVQQSSSAFRSSTSPLSIVWVHSLVANLLYRNLEARRPFAIIHNCDGRHYYWESM